jgi:hypothetical protein
MVEATFDSGDLAGERDSVLGEPTGKSVDEAARAAAESERHWNPEAGDSRQLAVGHHEGITARPLLVYRKTELANQAVDSMLPGPEPCRTEIGMTAAELQRFDPAAESRAGFEDLHGHAGSDEPVSDREPADAAADDRHVNVGHEESSIG